MLNLGKTRLIRYCLRPLFLGAVIWLMGLLTVFADGTRQVKEDTNKDGRIDRIAHLDATGNLVKLEADTNSDGVMDTFQYYEKGTLVRLERDMDADGLIDERDILERGKRALNEKLDKSGRVVSVIRFDDKEKPLRWDRDTTGDGKLDTVYHYEKGALTLITRDIDGDGRINIWQTFRNDKPLEQKADRDGDGRVEQIVYYDEAGNIARILTDTDNDDFMETLRIYDRGEIARQEKFHQGRDKPYHVIHYLEGLPVKELRDTNLDGFYDVVLTMDRGRPKSKEEDTDHDRISDRFTDFDASGRPALIREKNRISRFQEGRITSLEEVQDGKRIVTLFKNGKPNLQTIEEKGDGRITQRITFDEDGIIHRAEVDSDRDGRMDTWQHYRAGDMVKVEQDRNHDGRIDAVMEYEKGVRKKVLLDRDWDGRFESRQLFTESPWSMVTEFDTKGEGRFDERYFYRGDILRVKEIFSSSEARWIAVEEFNEEGRILISREASGTDGRYDLTWHYDKDEKVYLGEKDSDGDGRTDIWFYYEKGLLKRVEEDRNRDGRPDLWEHYDEAEAVVLRIEDLDFDGKPDIEKRP
jgi:antitoxin component YwqK of YwqJK toxin-antitoxin module